jgi:hypothetical protein
MVSRGSADVIGALTPGVERESEALNLGDKKFSASSIPKRVPICASDIF